MACASNKSVSSSPLARPGQVSAGPEVKQAPLAASRAPRLVTVKALAKVAGHQFCHQQRAQSKKDVVEKATSEGAPFTAAPCQVQISL